jgi:hypothetical protein
MKKIGLLYFIIILIFGLFVFAQKSFAISEPVHPVYKTKADYFDLVPIGLSENKTKVISYPWPGDIFYQGQLAYPTKLNRDYLMDNRGLWVDSVFLDMSYEDYSQIQNPSAKELLAIIKDKNPFVEFYDCGDKDVKEINKIIDTNKLDTECKILIKDSIKLEMSDKFGEDFSDINKVGDVVDMVKEKNSRVFWIIILISFSFGIISALVVKNRKKLLKVIISNRSIDKKE